MASEPQNIYDDPAFFSAYAALPRSQYGLSAAPEWPQLQHMVLSCKSALTKPTQKKLEGHRILDLGCGYGWFTRWARDNGAAYVKAVDISHKMISRAKQFETDASANSEGEIRFEVGDLETVVFDVDERGKGSYDLVYSSLTFHYVEDLGRVYRQIHASLKRDGRLVFSVEHPICSAPVHPPPDWKVFEEDGQERKVWPLNCYSDQGWRMTCWLGREGARKYHRTVETYVELLLESGFTLTGFKDWAPSLEDVATHPEWAHERHRPYFLLISAEKE